MFIRNFMENAVDELIDNVLNTLDVCKCERCRLDIKALALNNLPPRYVVTEKGELYTKTSELMQQFEVDIIKAITMAALYVNKNKHHQEA